MRLFIFLDGYGFLVGDPAVHNPLHELLTEGNVLLQRERWERKQKRMTGCAAAWFVTEYKSASGKIPYKMALISMVNI